MNISEEDMHKLLSELVHLRKQVTDLQRSNSDLLTQYREEKDAHMVTLAQLYEAAVKRSGGKEIPSLRVASAEGKLCSVLFGDDT